MANNRYSSRSPRFGYWGVVRPPLPGVVSQGSEREFLFWWHLIADRGRRGDGYRAAAGSPARYAQLRRFRAEGPDARPAVNEDEWTGARGAAGCGFGPRRDFSRASGRWEGHAGEGAGE